MNKKVLSSKSLNEHSLFVPLTSSPLEYDLITVGETPFTHEASELDGYVMPSNNELNMVFHFELMDVDSPKEGHYRSPLKQKEWTLAEFREIVVRWQNYKREEGFWNS